MRNSLFRRVHDMHLSKNEVLHIRRTIRTFLDEYPKEALISLETHVLGHGHAHERQYTQNTQNNTFKTFCKTWTVKAC